MAVEYYTCCQPQFFIQICLVIFLLLFWGLVSGLSWGLLTTICQADLENFAKFGTPKDKLNAAKILPVIKNHNLLFCTFVVWTTAGMEVLPVFLDGLVTEWGTISIYVTLILLFGVIIPQSTNHVLDIAAMVSPFVRILIFVCFPLAYPYSKLLDYFLGHEHIGHAGLRTCVGLHSNEAVNGGELTHDETTIDARALKLIGKTASDAMTPICETFAIDSNSRLDRSLMNLILENGHSKVPVYCEQPTNITGLLLVKNLINVDPDDGLPVKSSVAFHEIKEVPEAMPLYCILKTFQNGRIPNRMAVVIKSIAPGEAFSLRDGKHHEAVGIITMDDVIHELLQEEVVKILIRK